MAVLRAVVFMWQTVYKYLFLFNKCSDHQLQF